MSLVGPVLLLSHQPQVIDKIPWACGTFKLRRSLFAGGNSPYPGAALVLRLSCVGARYNLKLTWSWTLHSGGHTRIRT